MSDGEKKLDQYYYDLFYPPTQPTENDMNSRILIPGLGFLSGYTVMAYARNISLGRPYKAGMPLSILSGVVTAFALELVRRGGVAYHDWQNRRVFHYMMLHPEDFPPPKRIKFADFFCEWESNR